MAAVSGPVAAQPGPGPLGDPCTAGPCKLSGAAVRMTIPLPIAPHRFAGKFELVPLFNRGQRPVLRNGHQYYALRNTIGFRTDAGDLVGMFAGSRTDLASIPQVVWGIMPPDGPWAEASIPHDNCYRTKGTFLWYGHVGRTRAVPYTRAECDEILREAMVALGVPTWKRVTIWSAVRGFGAKGFGS
jgi:hypothetical protein